MAKSKSFVIGATVRITGSFYVDDVLTAPTTVVVTVEEPDGTQSTPTVTNPSTGVYQSCFTADQSGYHRFKIVGTGNNADGVLEGTFYINTSSLQ